MSKHTLLIIACAAVLGPAATANAGTITRDSSGALVYTAGSGEANLFDVGTGYDLNGDPDRSQVIFTDAAVVPEHIAADGCVAIMSYATKCRLDAAGVLVLLGDGDDRQTASSELPAGMRLADGGPGRDRLDAGIAPIAANLSGGEGDDQITGGPGADHLDGGAGDDGVDGQGGADVVLGGDGNDIVHGDHFETRHPTSSTAGRGPTS